MIFRCDGELLKGADGGDVKKKLPHKTKPKKNI